MSDFDQVLARIQSQLESLKRSLLEQREEFSEAVRQEGVASESTPREGGSASSGSESA